MQIGGLELELEALPRANPGEVEDLIDHARHPVRAALDPTDELLVGGRQRAGAQHLRRHADRGERVAQVVPHDCDEPFPQRGRLFGALPLPLGGVEELRVVHRRGCAPCQLLRKDQVMLVVNPRPRRREDDHGEGTPLQDDRDVDCRGDAKPPNQGRQLIVHLLGKKPLWSQLGMQLGASRSHHAAAGSGHSIGAPTLQVLNGGEQLRVRGVEQLETRLTLRIPQMDRTPSAKAGTAM